MKDVISYIKDKRKEYGGHAFFTELLDNPALPGEKRLRWAPSILPFIMGYADLNDSVFRKSATGNAGDRLQAMLSAHTYEEDFHWQWLLNDLSRLHANPPLLLSDSVRVMWSEEFKHSRVLTLELAALGLRAPTYVVFAMMEAIEAVSITIFTKCLGITLQNGDECEFFGTKHYMAESSHAIHSEAGAESKLPYLDEDQRRVAMEAVEHVFCLFSDWSDALLKYALTVEDHSTFYARIIAKSKSMLPVLDRPDTGFTSGGLA